MLLERMNTVPYGSDTNEDPALQQWSSQGHYGFSLWESSNGSALAQRPVAFGCVYQRLFEGFTNVV